MDEIKRYKAPGRPGTTPPGIVARKQGTGTTATNDSRVWFTVLDGAIGDISFPSPDRACVRMLKLIVTDENGFVSDETRHATSEVDLAAPGILEHRISIRCSERRYRLEKSMICHPRMDAVLMRVRFVPLTNGPRLRVFAYLVAYPFEAGASANVVDCKGERILTASTEGTGMALAASVPFRRCAVGFVGASDGLEQLREHGFLKREYTEANGAFVALSSEIDLEGCKNEWTLAVGFGGTGGEAAQHARGGSGLRFRR